MDYNKHYPGHGFYLAKWIEWLVRGTTSPTGRASGSVGGRLERDSDAESSEYGSVSCGKTADITPGTEEGLSPLVGDLLGTGPNLFAVSDQYPWYTHVV